MGAKSANNARKRLSTEMGDTTRYLLGLVTGGDYRAFGLYG